MDEFKRKRVEVDFPFDDYRFMTAVAFELGISVPELIRQIISSEKSGFLEIYKDYSY